MNVLEKKIYDYLIFHKLGYLKNPFLELLNTSLAGQTYKKMKDFIAQKDTLGLENFLKSKLDIYSISYQQKKYKYEDKTSSERQKRYQVSLREEGYKTIAITVPLSVYKRYQSLKEKASLTNLELFKKLLKNPSF